MNRQLLLATVISLALPTAALAGQTTITTTTPGASSAQVTADVQAQYQSDLAAYEQALAAHDHAANRDQAHYDHQRRAYADAMRAWRDQVWACHHGSDRACNAPTPNPADYW